MDAVQSSVLHLESEPKCLGGKSGLLHFQLKPCTTVFQRAGKLKSNANKDLYYIIGADLS